MTRPVYLVCAYVITNALTAQVPNAPSIRQEAGTATCSNVVLIQSTGKFECSGLSPAQAKLLQQLPSLISKLLKNEQGYSEQLVDKLDKVLTSQESMKRLFEEFDHAINPNLPVSVYDCRGVERITWPTGRTDIITDMSNSLQEMINMHNAREYGKLIQFSQKEIGEKPNWLTPYLFRADARLFFQNYSGAKADLEYFDQKKGPAYEAGTDCEVWERAIRSELDKVPQY